MAEQWQDEMLGIMGIAGKNVDIRFFEGELVGTSPLRFKPYTSSGDPVGAMFLAHVADGAAAGDRVLAIQDMKTRHIYVIGRVLA